MEFFIADTHFNDTSIIRFIPREILKMVGCKETTEDNIRKYLDNLILNNLKSLDKNDTLYHIGDVGKFKNIEEALEYINTIPCARKILVMGNHDSDPKYIPEVNDYVEFWKAAGFDEVYERSVLFDEFVTLRHIPPMFMNYPRFSIFGHIHLNPMFRTVTSVSCCVSVERWLFNAVSIDQITNLRNKIIENELDPDMTISDIFGMEV